MNGEVAADGLARSAAGRSRAADFARATVLVALFAVLTRVGLLAVGRAFRDSFESGRGEVVQDFAVFVACVILFVAALRFAMSRRVRWSAGLPALIVVVGLAAWGWMATLRSGAYHDFHGVWTQSAGQSWSETRGSRRLTYRHDRNGFRGTGFESAKAAGRLRVALVGDSFIFGMGVEEDQTLAARITEQLAQHGIAADQIEVLNLGIPGANMATHVRMYSIAHETLGADVIVMGLFEDNDLADWDVQDEVDALARPSAFSLGCYLFGERPAVVMGMALAQVRPLRAFDHIATRLAAIRERDGSPPLIVLDYYTHHPEIRERFTRMRGVSFIATPARASMTPGYYIPRDGHPSVRGNEHFARLVTEKLLAIPAVAAVARTVR